jgi:hypothetical protein
VAKQLWPHAQLPLPVHSPVLGEQVAVPDEPELLELLELLDELDPDAPVLHAVTSVP